MEQDGVLLNSYVFSIYYSAVAFNLKKLKPGVSLRTHRIAAASVWTLVGALLMFRGSNYLNQSGKMWFVLIALTVGTIKSLFLLDKSARKNSTRISGLHEGSCLGGIYSIKMWGLIACMILFGRLLRMSGLPFEYVGLIFTAIGWALFFSSRILWQNVYKSS